MNIFKAAVINISIWTTLYIKQICVEIALTITYLVSLSFMESFGVIQLIVLVLCPST